MKTFGQIRSFCFCNRWLLKLESGTFLFLLFFACVVLVFSGKKKRLNISLLLQKPNFGCSLEMREVQTTIRNRFPLFQRQKLQISAQTNRAFNERSELVNYTHTHIQNHFANIVPENVCPDFSVTNVLTCDELLQLFLC